MATLVDSYVDCFKKYATFRGRSARKEYVVFTVTNFVLSFVLGLIPLVGGIWGLAILLPGLAVAVRRLHDLNKSGWLLLAPYGVMIIGFIGLVINAESDNTTGWVMLLLVAGLAVLGMSLWMLFARGTTGSNRFGDDPLNPPASEFASVEPAKTTADDVRERLAQAKKMFDDGLINEVEYETMRSSIIKDM
ncbi:DUF805 domain-containing protein [Enterobacteriaceae bacterium RIT691]|nr:DUF805 domain-containing protein [Enterobacteriaceae bacterium RIT691]